ncbi:MAG: hypothetical protein SFU98_21115 [Leptospiraceae bacterium]|nr:hypothetical protein [Leptospiraceae bacterium]
MLPILFAIWLALQEEAERIPKLTSPCVQTCDSYLECVKKLKTDFRLKEESFKKESITCKNLCLKEETNFGMCFSDVMTTCDVQYFCMQRLFKKTYVEKSNLYD